MTCRIGFVLSTLLALGTTAAAAAEVARQPNIVIIFTDDKCGDGPDELR